MRILLLFAAVLLTACAGARKPDPQIQAVEDFVEVSELVEVDRIRTDSSSNYTELNSRYVVFHTRRQDYLIEFFRDCFELRDDFNIRADRRQDPNYMRPGLDTIRGCRIDRAFELNAGQVEELEAMGEAPSGVD